MQISILFNSPSTSWLPNNFMLIDHIIPNYIYMASNKIPTHKTQKGCYKFTKLFLPIGPSNLYHALTIIQKLETIIQITKVMKLAPLPIYVNPSNKSSKSLSHEFVWKMFVFRPLKNTTRLTHVISQVINLVKLTNLG